MIEEFADTYTVGVSGNLEYEVVYEFFNTIGYPWVLDTVFWSYDIAEYGAGYNSVWGFIDQWMYASDEWATTAPEGWYPIEERIVPWWPWETDHDVARDHLRDEIQAAIARLEEVMVEVDTLPLHELTWGDNCEDQMECLSDLITETIEWAEDDLLEEDNLVTVM